MNIFWKQWQSNILHKLSLTEHAVELEPYVTNFKLDQFVGGDEDYVKHVIQSFVDSAKVLKNSEPLNASKVYRYQVFLCYQIYNCIDSLLLKSYVLLTFSNF